MMNEDSVQYDQRRLMKLLSRHVVLLADDLDVSRGDMLCRPHNQPAAAQNIEAMVCWMSDTRPLTEGSRLVVKHTTRTVKAIVRDLQYRLDVNTLHRDEEADRLNLNDIGRVRLRTTVPLMSDEYSRNRTTGGSRRSRETRRSSAGTAATGTTASRVPAPRSPGTSRSPVSPRVPRRSRR